jgi:trigger factor
LETNVVSIDACTQEVRFSLTAQDLVPHYERAFKEAQATIEIKGFRKGKVPIPIIKQRFGRQIENDSLMNIADDEFKRYVRDNNIRVIGQPQLQDLQKDSSGGVMYAIRYDTVPAFELQEYKGLQISRPVQQVSDEDVENVISQLLLSKAGSEPAEIAEDQMHSVRVKFTLLDDETGMPVLGKKSEENVLFLNHPELDEDLRDSLMGKKVGDEISYVAPAADENSLPERFTLTVLGVEKIVPAELTDAFVQEYTKGRLNNAEELYADVRRYNNSALENEARKEMELQVVEQLTRLHDFMVPAAIVHEVMHGMVDNLKKQQKDNPSVQDMDFGQMEEMFRPYAEQTARWELIRDRIIEKEEIQLDENDVLPYLEYYRQNTKFSDEQIMTYLMRENNLLGSILAKKAMDKVLENAIITDIEAEAYFSQRDGFDPSMIPGFDGLIDAGAAAENTSDAAETSEENTAAMPEEEEKPKAAKKAKKAEASAEEESEEKPKRKRKAKAAGEDE